MKNVSSLNPNPFDHDDEQAMKMSTISCFGNKADETKIGCKRKKKKICVSMFAILK